MCTSLSTCVYVCMLVDVCQCRYTVSNAYYCKGRFCRTCSSNQHCDQRSYIRRPRILPQSTTTTSCVLCSSFPKCRPWVREAIVVVCFLSRRRKRVCGWEQSLGQRVWGKDCWRPLCCQRNGLFRTKVEPKVDLVYTKVTTPLRNWMKLATVGLTTGVLKTHCSSQGLYRCRLRMLHSQCHAKWVVWWDNSPCLMP